FRMTEPALRIVDVSRQFGGVAALTRVSLEVAEGTIYGLIGPNGAGKTTLFNLINGIYPVSAGRILVGGRDITSWRPAAVARAGGVAGWLTENARPVLRTAWRPSAGWNSGNGSAGARRRRSATIPSW